MTRSMEATPANAAAGPSSTESRTSTMVSSRGPPHRKHQNGIASSKRRTSFDTRFTICEIHEEEQKKDVSKLKDKYRFSNEWSGSCINLSLSQTLPSNEIAPY